MRRWANAARTFSRVDLRASLLVLGQHDDVVVRVAEAFAAWPRARCASRRTSPVLGSPGGADHDERMTPGGERIGGGDSHQERDQGASDTTPRRMRWCGSSQPPSAAQHPFGGQQRRSSARYAHGSVPQVAPFERRVGGRQTRGSPQPALRASSTSTYRPPELAASRRRHAFVQPRIRELAVAAADVEPAVGHAERSRSLARLGAHAVQPGALGTNGAPRAGRPPRPRVAVASGHRLAPLAPSAWPRPTRRPQARTPRRARRPPIRCDRRAPRTAAPSIDTGSGAGDASQRAACRQKNS